MAILKNDIITALRTYFNNSELTYDDLSPWQEITQAISILNDTIGTGISVTVATPSPPYTETQLTAPGTTTARAGDIGDKITFAVTIASINTSVTVRCEGSLDNSNWFNLDVNNTDTTYTANGTYALLFDRKLPYIRFNFVSESGGTDATLDVKIYVG